MVGEPGQRCPVPIGRPSGEVLVYTRRGVEGAVKGEFQAPEWAGAAPLTPTRSAPSSGGMPALQPLQAVLHTRTGGSCARTWARGLHPPPSLCPFKQPWGSNKVPEESGCAGRSGLYLSSGLCSERCIIWHQSISSCDPFTHVELKKDIKSILLGTALPW